MASFSLIAKSALLAAVLATPAAAAVVVPDSGPSQYFFEWTDGLGPIDGIESGTETQWSLMLTTESTVTFTATDDLEPGDAFGLLLGGLSTPWMSEGVSGDYFQGTYSAVLNAGSYLFSLEVTHGAEGFTSGGAYAAFDVVPTPVPLPAGGLLLMGALGGLAVLRRRKSV